MTPTSFRLHPEEHDLLAALAESWHKAGLIRQPTRVHVLRRLLKFADPVLDDAHPAWRGAYEHLDRA